MSVPISFIYGEYDWVHIFEGNISEKICSVNKFSGDRLPLQHGVNISKVYKVPSSDHSMHLDNPDALASAIVNDIFDAKLPLNRNIFTDAHIEANKKAGEETEEVISYPQEKDNNNQDIV